MIHYRCFAPAASDVYARSQVWFYCWSVNFSSKQPVATHYSAPPIIHRLSFGVCTSKGVPLLQGVRGVGGPPLALCYTTTRNGSRKCLVRLCNSAYTAVERFPWNYLNNWMFPSGRWWCCCCCCCRWGCEEINFQPVGVIPSGRYEMPVDVSVRNCCRCFARILEKRLKHIVKRVFLGEVQVVSECCQTTATIEPQ